MAGPFSRALHTVPAPTTSQIGSPASRQKTAPTTTTVTSDRMRARWKGTHFRVRVSTTTATLS